MPHVDDYVTMTKATTMTTTSTTTSRTITATETHITTDDRRRRTSHCCCHFKISRSDDIELNGWTKQSVVSWQSPVVEHGIYRDNKRPIQLRFVEFEIIFRCFGCAHGIRSVRQHVTFPPNRLAVIKWKIGMKKLLTKN